MMLVKLIGIALIGVVAVSVLRTAKPEFAAFAVIGTGIVMVITLLSSLQSAILAFDELVQKSGIDDRVFSAVLKIIANTAPPSPRTRAVPPSRKSCSWEGRSSSFL